LNSHLYIRCLSLQHSSSCHNFLKDTTPLHVINLFLDRHFHFWCFPKHNLFIQYRYFLFSAAILYLIHFSCGTAVDTSLCFIFCSLFYSLRFFCCTAVDTAPLHAKFSLFGRLFYICYVFSCSTVVDTTLVSFVISCSIIVDTALAHHLPIFSLFSSLFYM